MRSYSEKCENVRESSLTPLLYRKHFPFLFQILFRRLSAEEDYEPSEEVRLRMMTLLGALLAETGEL